MPIMDTIPKWQQARPMVRSPGQTRLRNTITVTGVPTGHKQGRYYFHATITIVLRQMKQEPILPHPAITAAEVHHHQAAAVRAQ